MADTNREHKALLERIFGSKFFKTAPDMRSLLLYFFENRHRKIKNAETIEIEHFKRPKFTDKHDPSHARVQIDDMKVRLDKYKQEAQNERWECSLPNANEVGGYQLLINERVIERTASEIFWAAHLESGDDIVVVCGDHLFFYDPSQNSTVRFFDFNIDDEPSKILAAFRTAYPTFAAANLEPSHNFYLAMGEVRAHEILQRWFHKRSGNLITRFTCREIKDDQILRSSPILLGRRGTNTFIKTILDSPQAAHLGYRLETSIGDVSIKGITEPERASLSEFSVDENGVLKAVPNWGVVFGIVTRLRNPGGYGCVTIVIFQFYSRGIGQVVEALTDDRLARDVLRRMDWPDGAVLPESFEMLFAVKRSPGNLEGEGRAELLCWRPYSKLP